MLTHWRANHIFLQIFIKLLRVTVCCRFLFFMLRNEIFENMPRYFIFFFYIHGSVLRDFILIRSNEMQQYAGVCLLQNYSITLHVSGVNRAHHQDYIKV